MATTRKKTVKKEGGTNRVKATLAAAEKAPKAKQSASIAILHLELQTFDVLVVGLTPLIMHKFSEKAKKAIEDKQQQKAKQAKGKRDPKGEYLAACYVMPGSEAGKKGCKYAIPSITLKAAMVAACRYVDGMPMTIARGAFQVLGEDQGLIPITFAGTQPVMREDAIRLPNGNLDMRYRPEFKDWKVKVQIRINAAVISKEQVINLLSLSGFHCGIMELRPNSKSGPGGENGMYAVETA